jgi:hypothetical protein
MQSSTMLVSYANNTKNICLYLGIVMFLIILFIMTPLQTFTFGKIIILLLLSYIIYTNTYYTNKFSNDYNITMLNGSWNEIKTNILCGYIFTLFSIFLFISILRKLL